MTLYYSQDDRGATVSKVGCGWIKVNISISADLLLVQRPQQVIKQRVRGDKEAVEGWGGTLQGEVLKESRAEKVGDPCVCPL